jgi:hypothetical protein
MMEDVSNFGLEVFIQRKNTSLKRSGGNIII